MPSIVRKYLPRVVEGIALSLAGTLIVLHAIAFVWAARHVFAIRRLTAGIGDTVFYDARGKPWFRMDEQRRDVPLNQISPALRNAVIAVEDHRFYRHGALDFRGLARAAMRDVRSGGVVEGGSTLTQQLARMIFLSNERTWGRKLKEAALAELMEGQLTKDQILELYLNRVYLSGGVYGVENMAHKLFGKKAQDLTVPEAAMIAGLIRAPSALSPWVNPEGAIARSRVVLGRMYDTGFITAEAEREAASAPPRVRSWAAASTIRAGYAKDYLRQRFRDSFGGDHPPDWQVHTTFLPELQDIAERAVARGLARRHAGLEAALVALDPATGDVLALVGGRGFHESPFDRAVRARRQPGSAFKPFVFAAALQRGYSPVSVVSGLDAFAVSGPEEWSPQNAHGEARDEMTLRQALLESNNRASAALAQRISTRSVLRVASDAGIRDLPDVPSLALGTGEVTPLDLTLAYAVFANGGFALQPRSITKVLDADGETALESGVQRRQVLTPQVAYQMVSMLQDVIDRGTGVPARAYGVSFPVAGKTGTTDGFKDAWFVGFSTSLVAGVWVGYDQPAPIGSNAYGARIALPIWAEFMNRAARLRTPARFNPPAGMRAEPLCRVSYLKPMHDCPLYTEYFKDDDSVPDRLCPLHGGPLKQRAARAVEGFFTGIGRKLKGLFGGGK
ncbi:MAG TPA: PBP1A family penicillin-binding protein [Bryobacteraceae bacterium]|nr:PBP1A family penicillin-binding protein [Bryobacteraceae bacterium]